MLSKEIAEFQIASAVAEYLLRCSGWGGGEVEVADEEGVFATGILV